MKEPTIPIDEYEYHVIASNPYQKITVDKKGIKLHMERLLDSMSVEVALGKVFNDEPVSFFINGRLLTFRRDKKVQEDYNITIGDFG